MFADWLNAAATLVAAIAAVFAGRVAYDASRRERERDEAEKDRDRRRPGEAVSAWLISGEPLGGPPGCIAFQNNGQAPVFDVTVSAVVNGNAVNAPRRESWQVMPPGNYLIRPHEKFGWDLPRPRTDDDAGYVPYTRSAKFMVTDVYFTDAAGQRWHRCQSGQLDEVVDQEARN